MFPTLGRRLLTTECPASYHHSRQWVGSCSSQYYKMVKCLCWTSPITYRWWCWVMPIPITDVCLSNISVSDHYELKKTIQINAVFVSARYLGFCKSWAFIRRQLRISVHNHNASYIAMLWAQRSKYNASCQESWHCDIPFNGLAPWMSGQWHIPRPHSAEHDETELIDSNWDLMIKWTCPYYTACDLSNDEIDMHRVPLSFTSFWDIMNIHD